VDGRHRGGRPARPGHWDRNFLRLEHPWAGTPEAFAATVQGAAREVGLRTAVVEIASEPQAGDWAPRLPPRVVSAAVAASRAAGHALTFISAHEDDWPRQLYARLGFGVVGTISRFRRT
jgi:hypothetical protein